MGSHCGIQIPEQSRFPLPTTHKFLSLLQAQPSSKGTESTFLLRSEGQALSFHLKAERESKSHALLTCTIWEGQEKEQLFGEASRRLSQICHQNSCQYLEGTEKLTFGA